MKLPAIKGVIGDWIYYQTVISFEKVAELIDNNHSIREYSTLNDVLQRDLSARSKKIKNYLLREDSRFFNSAIIGLYGENPNWYQFNFSPSAIPEMELSEEILNTIGILEFNGGEILFSIDGQHRIDGIKQALKANPDKFKFDELPVIIIAHNDSDVGKIRTRRLFSEINTKAVRVSGLDDLITNEDNPSNINARRIYTEFTPFEKDEFISLNKKVNIDASSTKFTTILNIKDVNNILYSPHYTTLDFRPSDEIIENLYQRTLSFWQEAIEKISYYNSVFIEKTQNVSSYRNSDGGNMLFRPLGINILAQCYTIWHQNDFQTDFWSAFSNIDPNLDGIIWKDVIWDNAKKNIKKTNVKFLREYTKYLLGIESDEEYLKIEYNKMKGIESGAVLINLPPKPNH
jgi:DNA sulfur modification protein DndB